MNTFQLSEKDLTNTVKWSSAFSILSGNSSMDFVHLSYLVIINPAVGLKTHHI